MTETYFLASCQSINKKENRCGSLVKVMNDNARERFPVNTGESNGRVIYFAGLASTSMLIVVGTVRQLAVLAFRP